MSLSKIIHIDMDAFYASVEQRDNPSLKGKPVIVGGDPDRRGVVSTCSYEARKYGVHSAMPSRTAIRLCPHAIFIHPRFEAYKSASRSVMAICRDYTDLVEPLSLDEAYLDVTGNKKGAGSATLIAREIRGRIFEETGLTASAGVSYNKFLAKTASDINKPDGIAVITPPEAEKFLESLPIGRFYGIGGVTEKRMISLGINNGLDLKNTRLEKLVEYFGKAGKFYYDIVRGIDTRPVTVERVRKSIGREITLEEDITGMDEIERILTDIAIEVESMLQRRNLKGRTITLKIKYHDFTLTTRSSTPGIIFETCGDMLAEVLNLLRFTEAGVKKIRLLGITISGLGNEKEDIADRQLILPCCM